MVSEIPSSKPARLRYIFFCMFAIIVAEVITMQEMLIMLGVVIGWVVLNRWVLPRLGVQT